MSSLLKVVSTTKLIGTSLVFYECHGSGFNCVSGSGFWIKYCIRIRGGPNTECPRWRASPEVKFFFVDLTNYGICYSDKKNELSFICNIKTFGNEKENLVQDLDFLLLIVLRTTELRIRDLLLSSVASKMPTKISALQLRIRGRDLITDLCCLWQTESWGKWRVHACPRLKS